MFAVHAGAFGGTAGELQEVARFNLEYEEDRATPFAHGPLIKINGEEVDSDGRSLVTNEFPKIVIGGTVINPVQPFGELTNGAEGQTTSTGSFSPHNDGGQATAITLDLVLGGLEASGIQDPAESSPYMFVEAAVPWGPGLSELFHSASMSRQRGVCGDESWCQGIWNSDTRSWEGTRAAASSVADDSDWVRLQRRLTDLGVAFVPPTGLPDPATPTALDCGGSADANGVVTPMEFIADGLTFPDQVVLVMDVSGSMTAKDACSTCGNETRLEFAQAAARLYAGLNANNGVKLGLVSFSSEARTDMPLKEIGIGAEQATVNDFNTAVDELEADGMTAMSAALLQASDMLDMASTNAKAIVFMSDGENNPPAGWRWSSDPSLPDPVDVATELASDGVTIIGVPVGSGADRAVFSGMVGERSGDILGADRSAELPSVFLGAYAGTRGETLAMDRMVSGVERIPPIMGFLDNAIDVVDRAFTVIGDLVWTSKMAHAQTDPTLPEYEVFEFDVELGAEKLNLLISVRDMPAADWGPAVLVRRPDGTECADCNLLVDEFFKLYTIEAPAQGTWEVQIQGTDIHPIQTSFVTAHIEHAGPDCFVSTNTRVVADGDSVTVTAFASTLGNVLTSGVDIDGYVERLDGSTFPLNFAAVSENGEYKASVAPSSLNGRSTYKVYVSCVVVDGAGVHPGESLFAGTSQDPIPTNNVDVDGFTRKASTQFFYDTSTLASCVSSDNEDADHDGILNVDEPAGDTDGDGRLDICDDDADGDDTADSVDPDPTDANIPNITTPVPDSIGATAYFDGEREYWFSTLEMAWESARDTCDLVGMDLVRIDDPSENLFIKANISGGTWIGASEIVDDEIWQWSDGTAFWSESCDSIFGCNGIISGGGILSGFSNPGEPIDGLYSNWDADQPSNSGGGWFSSGVEDCAEMQADGRWNDAECSDVKTFVCETRSDVQGPTASSSAPAADCVFASRDGADYWFCAGDLEHDDAQASCAAQGLTLVTIDDSEENAFVHVRLSQSAWLGGSDSAQEGAWSWTDGTQFWQGDEDGSAVAGLYTHWDAGEPNNSGGGGWWWWSSSASENCAEMLISTGEWNDVSCSNNQPYICEAP
ncbi:MAG: VWA domain-containing protein [Polyangiaceae bacterium]|nr:VWA domain-containing protein [Polyangiaceae bacterium]